MGKIATALTLVIGLAATQASAQAVSKVTGAAGSVTGGGGMASSGLGVTSNKYGESVAERAWWIADRLRSGRKPARRRRLQSRGTNNAVSWCRRRRRRSRKFQSRPWHPVLASAGMSALANYLMAAVKGRSPPTQRGQKKNITCKTPDKTITPKWI
jgi:hypothetical protein